MPNNNYLDWLVCAATEMELNAFGELPEGSFLTGVGIPMALAQTLLVAGDLKPARLLNIGIAGAYPSSGLAIGDIVIGTSEIYGDIGFEWPEAPGFRHVRESPWGKPYEEPMPLTVFPEFAGAREGRGCTVNACTGTEAAGRMRENLFEAAFETMEGAAVAMAGQRLGIHVCEIRAISNFASTRDMRPENIRTAIESLRIYLHTCRKEHHDAT